jgi:hypothetical protein
LVSVAETGVYLYLSTGRVEETLNVVICSQWELSRMVFCKEEEEEEEDEEDEEEEEEDENDVEADEGGALLLCGQGVVFFILGCVIVDEGVTICTLSSLCLWSENSSRLLLNSSAFWAMMMNGLEFKLADESSGPARAAVEARISRQ